MIKIIDNFDLSQISYIKIGGICKRYITFDDLNYLSNLPDKFIAISSTSKILFAFNYTPITYIKFIKDNIIFFNDSYFIYAGARLIDIYNKLCKYNLSGFEKISTIPGLLGGSIVNNSSFLNQCISDNLIKILVFENGKFHFLSKKELNFSYRSSSLKRNNILIIGGYFKKVYKDEKAIKDDFIKAIQYRYKHQKEHLMTLGSTFKNPNNISIGKVIDKLNLKGFYLDKNVKISSNHGNFIIVNEKSNYLHVLHLITTLKCVLYNYLGVTVDLEIVVINDDGEYGIRFK